MSRLGPEAREILEAGRAGDEPTAADRLRMRARVMGAVAAGGASRPRGAEGGSPRSPGAVAPKGARSLGWKVLAGLGVLGLVGAGLLAGRARSEAAAPPTAAAPVAPESQPDRQTAPANEPPPAIPSAAGPAAAPPEHDEGSRPKPSSIPPDRSTAQPLASAGRRHPATPPEGAAPGGDDDTLAAETRRLREAHGALQGGDPAQALAMLDALSTAYPNGQLREERAADRVLALCRLGRVDEARAAATRFLAEHPRSPLAPRVRSACPAGRAP